MKNKSLNGGKMKRRIYDVLTIVALLLFISGMAQADILMVPSQYPTIQDGLNAALASDTVLVSVGTYYENIIWPSTDSIHLMSEAGASQTIIDGDNNGRVMSITTGVGLDTEIRGFTIRHGYVSGYDGAGILCENSSPTIIENIITYNNAHSVTQGGGIRCYNANPLIRDNQITYNEAHYGAGIGLKFSNPIIEGNIISGNHTHSGSGWAAGIDCYDASPVIIGNTISNNSCQWNGAGIYCTRSDAIIQFNDILYNACGCSETGGIQCCESPDLRINFNNIVGNNYGVWNSNSGDSLNAENNWWGDPSGPGGVGPGTGDSVNVNVDYIPFLQEEAPPLPVVSTDTNYGTPGDTISVPIMVSELLPVFGVVSAEFTLIFESSIIIGVDVETSGTLLSGTDWTVQFNASGDSVHVYMAGTDTLAGIGTLSNLIFVVSPDAQPGQESPLHFVDFLFNEGTPAVTTQDGIFIVTSVGVDDETPQVTKLFALNQNYPNPFNPTTTISFSVTQTSPFVNLEIYNIKGQKVKTLINDILPPGNHSVVWNGKNDNNENVSSGIYFYRITAGNFTDTKKCVILK